MKKKNEQLQLSHWGLPQVILAQYEQKGLHEMFEWQAECLCQGTVMAGNNLVYSAPTSAGKTLVAELLLLKRVLETKLKAIMILPFVSVAREKLFHMQTMFQDAGVRVAGFIGNMRPAGGFSGVDIAVCTIEKANSLVNRLIEDHQADQLGIVVVDELHMVGDPHRGYLLELLLTKIQFLSVNNRGDGPAVQIVGMSATLPNLDLLARWLHADLYHTDFRPVPLSETVKIGNVLYDSSFNKIKDIDVSYQLRGDDENIISLCLETIGMGHSVLIFCPTKNWCEKLSESIAREFYNILRISVQQNRDEQNPGTPKLVLDHAVLNDVIQQLMRTPVGVDKQLRLVVPYGVAFHHAGLTADERDVIEGAFRQCHIRVLVATSTLCSGVNLPARRVIIRSPMFHGQTVNTLTYKQMVGRAGRKGVDTMGESILICKPQERAQAHRLVTSHLPPVQSCLSRSGEHLSSSMKRAILEVVVSGVACTPEQVDRYARCTLLAASLTAEDGSGRFDAIDACIHFLQTNEIIVLREDTDEDGKVVQRYVPSQLGSAILTSALSPDEGLVVFRDLQKARKCFVLENELHVIYQVTPIYMSDMWAGLDWYQYLSRWEALSADQRRVADLVGVKEAFINRAIRGRLQKQTAEQLRAINIHKRFYTALVLNDLVNEVPLPEVARRYGTSKGTLQSLQQSAATFAGMVTVFCNRLGWSFLELLFADFQSRLTFGVQRELVDLVRLSMINAHRARALYDAGVQSVADVAKCDVIRVEQILQKAVPFDSCKKTDGETDWDVEQRKKSRCIWVTGQKGLTETEAAAVIIEEAKQLVTEDASKFGVDLAKAEITFGVRKDYSPDVRNVMGHKKKSRRKSDSHRARRESTGRKNKGSSGQHASPDEEREAPAHTRSVLQPPDSLIQSLHETSVGVYTKQHDLPKPETKSKMEYERSEIAQTATRIPDNPNEINAEGALRDPHSLVSDIAVQPKTECVAELVKADDVMEQVCDAVTTKPDDADDVTEEGDCAGAGQIGRASCRERVYAPV